MRNTSTPLAFGLPCAALALLAASPAAFAGGVGIVGTGGVNTEHVYFYDSSNSFSQCKQTQLLANYGTGLEFILGDRDDKITGVFRGYWLQDAPEIDPATNGGAGADDCTVAQSNIVSNVRDTPSNVGAGTFGVQWGILGNPDKIQLVLLSSVGSGFLSPDRREFLILQAGVGGTMRFSHRIELFVELDASARYRKRWTWGETNYLGARYLFD